MFGLKLFLSIFYLIFPVMEEHEWEKSLEKDNIIIYTRHVSDSNFKEFLAETTMEGSIDQFIEIFTDIKNYSEWMPDCKSVKIVDSPTPYDITYHMKIKVPFPFAGRDVVQQIILSRKDSLLEVELINQPQKIAEDKKQVRMQTAKGKWLVEEISDQEIAIKFQFLADPGGDIPAWLVNSFVVKSPHQTLVNLKELMAE